LKSIFLNTSSVLTVLNLERSHLFLLVSQSVEFLLYPSTHSKIRNERIISGKKISIKTVNLNQDWNDVESELLEIINTA